MAMQFNHNRVNIIGAWTNYNPVTVCLWFKVNSFTSGVPHRMVGSDDNWEVRVTDSWTSPGDFRFSNELWSSTPSGGAVSSTVIVPNIWYHGAATSNGNGSSGTLWAFLNGVREGSFTSNSTPTSTSFTLGGRFTAPDSEGIVGYLDDIRVYNRILSDNEIMTIYTCQGSDDILEGLQNRWVMTEGAEGVAASGIGVVKDLTGRQHGTPVTGTGGSGLPLHAGSFIKIRGT